MYINFNELPNNSRVWIYQADRDLSKEECTSIDVALLQFTSAWEAHQHPLQASFQVLYHRFICLAVDGSYHEPSGCSIDKSVAIIRQIEQMFDLKLFDRLTVAYLENGNIKTLKNKDIRQKIASGEFSPETIIFNNIVQTKEELDRNWKIAASQSWLSKYFETVMA
ncbi:MAG: hypothetical protein EAZ08_12600 [Cytophagales bacterium]|nr:MAG: hypothetical protein EAZ08_12600 [Cytophagales bacterium]